MFFCLFVCLDIHIGAAVSYIISEGMNIKRMGLFLF